MACTRHPGQTGPAGQRTVSPPPPGRWAARWCTLQRRMRAPDLGGERVPVVPALAHRGTISLSVLENIITPRAPCNSRPNRLPAWSPGCRAAALLAAGQGLKKALGPRLAPWCQSELIVKPGSEPPPRPLSPNTHSPPSLFLCTADWHTAWF